jgi:hypothetical protein
VSVVEFASLLAAISMLASSLSGLQARILQRLAGSDTVAVQQAVLGSKASHVPPAGARAAYARAPYRKPALRYVYATGWVAGTKHQTACALAGLDDEGATSLVIKAIRKQPATMRQLRRLHLTAVQAANAFTRGFVSACGG